MKGQSIGAYLFHVRKVRRLTLRAVERATGKGVSNSYLSQLEHDRIRRPSPDILMSLAKIYAISYDVLMEKAGYTSGRCAPGAMEPDRAGPFAAENLTSEEQEELLRYLAFLRSRARDRI